MIAIIVVALIALVVTALSAVYFYESKIDALEASHKEEIEQTFYDAFKSGWEAGHIEGKKDASFQRALKTVQN